MLLLKFSKFKQLNQNLLSQFDIIKIQKSISQLHGDTEKSNFQSYFFCSSTFVLRKWLKICPGGTKSWCKPEYGPPGPRNLTKNK